MEPYVTSHCTRLLTRAAASPLAPPTADPPRRRPRDGGPGAEPALFLSRDPGPGPAREAPVRKEVLEVLAPLRPAPAMPLPSPAAVPLRASAL